MTQASDIKQQDSSNHYSKDTYTDRRARMFQSSAQRHAQCHSFLSGEDVLKLAQSSVKVKGNKDDPAA
jgi:hypothetical protein